MAIRPGSFFSREVLSNCAPKRRVQLPARSFQLLARPSKDVEDHYMKSTRVPTLRSTQVRPQQKQSVNRYSTEEQVQRQVRNHERKTTTSGASRNGGDGSNAGDTADQKAGARDMFRKYMQRAIHPVAIVTSTDTSIDRSGGPESWRGATVSSFNSVTLDPEPYVSFNIKRISSTYDAIQHSGLFTIHLMSHTAEAVMIATKFSMGNSAGPFFKGFRNTNFGRVRELQSFILDRAIWDSRLNTYLGQGLPPLLQWRQKGISRAVLFQMLCKHEANKSVEVGDHVVVIGKVLAAIGNLDDNIERDNYEAQVPEHCLSYVNGRYSHPHAGDPTQLVLKKRELGPTLTEEV